MKEKLKFIALNAAKMLVSFLVGYLFKMSTPPPPGWSVWFVGAMAFIILNAWDQGHQIKKHAEDHRAALAKMAELMAESSAAQTLLEVAMSFADRPLSRLETNQAWRKLSWYAQSDYRATNFQAPDRFYAGPDVKDILNLQLAKKCCDEKFVIKKVFIWKDEAERTSEASKAILENHRKDSRAKMCLRGILKEAIDANVVLKDELAKLEGQIDFAVFDNKVVLVWKLDPSTRDSVGGTVLVSGSKVGQFSGFFDTLYSKSAEVD